MKKILIPVLAVSMAVFSAFATKPTSSLFRFNGSPTSWQDRTDPTKYSMATPTGCGGEVTLCSIIAVQNGTTGQPLIGPGSLYDALNNSAGTAPNFDHIDIDGKP